MKFSLKWFWVLSVVALIFIPSPAQGQFAFDENPLLNKQAPDFTLKTLTGESMSLSQFRSNEPTIIFFWATWCPHCREELKTLGKNAAAIQKTGIKILLVDIEESARQVKAFIDKYSVPFTVFLDEKSEVAEQYSLIGVPTLFLIDKDGVIIAMEHELPVNYIEMLKPVKK